MASKLYTLILVRNEGSRFRKWRFSALQFGLALALAAAVTAAAAFSLWSFVEGRVDRAELSQLRQENDTLRLTNQSFETRLQSLQADLSSYEDRTRRLAIVAGIENLGASSEAGIGGTASADPATNGYLAAAEGRVEHLGRALDQVESRLSDNLKLISATPSILPVRGLYTSNFGFRRDPITGQRAFHSGIDVSASPGRPVKVTAAGVVISTEEYGPLGRSVKVAHGYGITTIYGHLSRVNVTPGQRLDRGELVGLVGNTGRATGYHLHYEVHVDGRPVNPLGYILDASDAAR